MICPNCGQQFQTNVQFCSNCGYRFAPQAQNPVPNTYPYANVQPQPQPQLQPQPPQKKKKKGCMTAFLIVVGIVFLFLVFLFFLGFFAPDNNKSTKNDTSSQQVAENGALGDYYIVIKDWKIVKEYDDDILIVTYSFGNYSSSSATFMYSVTAKAYQNGIECPQEYYLFSDDTFDFEADDKAVQPGYFLDVPCAYKLSNLSTKVVIELERSFSISSEKISYTIDITEQ